MKYFLVALLLVVAVAQLTSAYSSCGKHFFYTEDYPTGYVEQVDYRPYSGACPCSRCSPALYTQLYRDCNTFY
uniref:Uncharacterized protein n=1 Tax=Anopheles dirus TaxID=7168 RepID=A0A182NLJ1_9DIPT